MQLNETSNEIKDVKRFENFKCYIFINLKRILEAVALNSDHQRPLQTSGGSLTGNYNRWRKQLAVELIYQALITKRENHSF